MVTRDIPDRVRWAADVVDPAPEARVLEIGCGPGAVIELIAPRLDTDQVRSAVAVRYSGEFQAAVCQRGLSWHRNEPPEAAADGRRPTAG